jgi:hypothetical protein
MKKLVFSLIATVFMGVSLINAQSSPKNFLSLGDLGFGKISSYAGPCVDGSGICSGSVSNNPLGFSAGISRVSETVVSFAFSKEFYQTNLRYLEKGLYIGMPFSLPKSVTEKIAVNGEFIVAPGTYQVVEKEGFYFVSLPREK